MEIFAAWNEDCSLSKQSRMAFTQKMAHPSYLCCKTRVSTLHHHLWVFTL